MSTARPKLSRSLWPCAVKLFIYHSPVLSAFSGQYGQLIRPRSNVIDKVIGSLADAVSDMEPGSVIGISGFGVVHGFPVHLIAAVRDHGARDLVVVTNSRHG